MEESKLFHFSLELIFIDCASAVHRLFYYFSVLVLVWRSDILSKVSATRKVLKQQSVTYLALCKNNPRKGKIWLFKIYMSIRSFQLLEIFECTSFCEIHAIYTNWGKRTEKSFKSFLHQNYRVHKMWRNLTSSRKHKNIFCSLTFKSLQYFM